MSRRHLVVLGSLNMDMVIRAPRLPVPGETVEGHEFVTVLGGKGANQAVAAARLGAPTFMVGRVGNDGFGRALLAGLREAGVNAEGVWVDEGVRSGVAVIVVDQEGQNQIVLAAGANGRVGNDDVARLRPRLEGAAALLLQLEVPLPAVLEAAKAARAAGVPVILDPAPAREGLPNEVFRLADVLTPNEAEASCLAGFPVTTAEEAARAVRVFRQRGANTVIIKRGAQGIFWASDAGEGMMPAFPVQAVDTVAAGDAFNAALAVALAEGRSFHQALVWGVAAGALAVTKHGAQPAMPTRQMLERFLASS
ncbi:MAG: ribokinase [Ardenticatenia bacterium]|nr:ribokinase [Ardenticatenia bacterium]